MINSDFIDQLVKRLSESVPPGLHAFKNDIERNFRAVLQNAFSQLDLVTREEFDAQTGVLLKTRSKLSELEKQVAQLEKHSAKHVHTGK